MTNKIKIVAVIAGAVLLMAVLAGMRFSSTVAEDQGEHLRLLTENQVSFARHTLQTQINDLTRQLLSRIEEEASGLAPSQAMVRERAGLGDFLSVLWLGDRKVVSWMSVQPAWKKRFTLPGFEKQKDRLPLLVVKETSVIWTRLTEENGRPVFAMLVEAQSRDGSKGIAVGILSPQVFSDLGGFYKAQSAELILVDDKGFALAYTSPQYVGAQIINHPAVEKLLAQLSVASSGEADNMDGEDTVFAYERLGDSNLYVILTNPLNKASHYLPGYLFNLAGMALALTLISTAIVVVLVRRQSLSFDGLKETVHKIASGQSFLIPDERNQDLMDIRQDLIVLSGGVPERPDHLEVVPKEVPTSEALEGMTLPEAPAPKPLPEIDKGEVLKEMGLGLVESLRPSMAAILGHAQLARSKAGDDDKLKQHFSVIERESRRIREILENLEDLVKDDESNLEKVDLQETIMSALASMRTVLQDKGVQLKKSLKDNGPVMISPKGFRFVIEEIVHNAIAAMESSATREIEVWTESKGSKIAIVFKDTGKGIPRDQLARIFDPFFTTEAREEKSGLGLTMAKRILAACDSQIKVSSVEGQGTEIRIEMPLVGVERRTFNDEETVKIMTPPKELEEMTLTSINLDEGSGIKILSVESEADTEGLTADSSETLNIESMAPLTGSKADELPTSPGDDEITFVGKVLDHDKVFSEISEEGDEASATVEEEVHSPEISNLQEFSQEIPKEFVQGLSQQSSMDDKSLEIDIPQSDPKVEIAEFDLDSNDDDEAGGFSQVDLSRKTAESLIDDVLNDDEDQEDKDDEFSVQIRPPKIKV